MNREEFFAEFLNDELVKSRIRSDDLAGVYSILPIGARRSAFSALLFEKHVNPFDYLPRYIPEAAFTHLSSNSGMPEKVYIEDTVENILHHAFSGNQAIKIVYLPANLKRVSWEAFADCKNLEKIYYPGTADKLLKEVDFERNWRSTDLKITCLDKEVFV